MSELNRPIVKLVGSDGNAFAIIAACGKAARKAGWSDEKISEIRHEMMRGNYTDLLAVACNYFDVR